MDNLIDQILNKKFRRIIILGSPGSGKSTFAQIISERLNINLYSMDDLYWLPGWNRPIDSKFRSLLLELVHGEQWIIEGHYERYISERAERAEVAVYLDVPTYIALYRLMKRFVERICFKHNKSEKFSANVPLQIYNTNSYVIRPRLALKLFIKVICFNLISKPKIIEILKIKSIPMAKIKNYGIHQFEAFYG